MTKCNVLAQLKTNENLCIGVKKLFIKTLKDINECHRKCILDFVFTFFFSLQHVDFLAFGVILVR